MCVSTQYVYWKRNNWIRYIQNCECWGEDGFLFSIFQQWAKQRTHTCIDIFVLCKIGNWVKFKFEIYCDLHKRSAQDLMYADACVCVCLCKQERREQQQGNESEWRSTNFKFVMYTKQFRLATNEWQLQLHTVCNACTLNGWTLFAFGDISACFLFVVIAKAQIFMIHRMSCHLIIIFFHENSSNNTNDDLVHIQRLDIGCLILIFTFSLSLYPALSNSLTLRFIKFQLLWNIRIEQKRQPEKYPWRKWLKSNTICSLVKARNILYISRMTHKIKSKRCIQLMLQIYLLNQSFLMMFFSNFFFARAHVHLQYYRLGRSHAKYSVYTEKSMQTGTEWLFDTYLKHECYIFTFI